MSALGLYWHTMRHLRPVQIYGRALFRLARPRPDPSPPPPRRPPARPWVKPVERKPSLVGPETFLLLNERHSLADHGWDDPAVSKLWRYNQHYFDDLNARGATDRADWHVALIERWIRENPAGKGTGWEPYPTSLRIVNWIKWELGGGPLPDEAIASLAVQARWLERRLEWHLLGNHLFSNAKALVLAGLFFEGAEAERWLRTGLAILDRELPEQILADGGQFELSPMYHALALEDLLDLANLARCFERASPHAPALAEAARLRIEPMRRWLAAMTHPDGEIAFFNDAAFGVAALPSVLDAYAGRLGLSPEIAGPAGTVQLAASGYLRAENARAVLIVDAARIGPDYLPGHAHADTLSFELSADGRRLLVNSGTSEYGAGPERLRQRGTAAHNTVIVDGENSSEIWSGFRVARRARPSKSLLDRQDGTVAITARHDGYARLAGRPIHRREWKLDENELLVSDFISGPVREAAAHFHFHPDLALRAEGAEGSAWLDGHPILSWTVERGSGRVEPSTWHPEFGLSLASQQLVVACLDNGAAVRFTLAERATPCTSSS